MPVKLELGIEPLVKQEIIIAPIGASMVPLPVGVGEDTTVTGPHSSRKEVIMTVEEAAKARLQKGYALQPVLAVTTPPPELVTGPGKRNRKSSMHFGHSPEPEGGTPSVARHGASGGGGRPRPVSVGGGGATPRAEPEIPSVWLDKKRALQERLRRINAQLKKLGAGGGAAAQPAWIAPPVTPRTQPGGAHGFASPWYATPQSAAPPSAGGGGGGSKRKLGVDSPSLQPAVKRARKKGAERLGPVGKFKNLYAHSEMLLDSIMKDRIAKTFFNVPVDPVALNLPDYFEKVRRPMDLGTVKERLSNEYYDSAEQFQEDVNLVWDNAMSYNPPGTEVHEGARALKDSTEKRFKKLPKMTFEEKKTLSLNINKLPSNSMFKVLEIIKRRRSNVVGQDADEVEIDIDLLDNATLRELDKFVKDCFKPSANKSKPSKTQALQAAAQAAVGSVGNAGRGNSSSSGSDSESEDSDLGGGAGRYDLP
ncbi:hypothetical protein T484DRAFT_1742982 [Baffinella frigidus]|nr:hypothetical protein T484DRAFT_1742982 [Cryptophyta sp. CCMP2293]